MPRRKQRKQHDKTDDPRTPKEGPPESGALYFDEPWLGKGYPQRSCALGASMIDILNNIASVVWLVLMILAVAVMLMNDDLKGTAFYGFLLLLACVTLGLRISNG
jgi:hypothetical protein